MNEFEKLVNEFESSVLNLSRNAGNENYFKRYGVLRSALLDAYRQNRESKEFWEKKAESLTKDLLAQEAEIKQLRDWLQKASIVLVEVFHEKSQNITRLIEEANRMADDERE